MLHRKRKQSSIVNRLTWLILGIIILQTVLYGIMLVYGGVLEQSELNAYQLFHDKVQSRKDYVQREMKNKWINFDSYLSNIKKLLHGKEGEAGYFDEDIMSELIAMLRTTEATGAYIIMVPDGEIQQDLPALYIRDYDPLTNSNGNEDLYMVVGPAVLARNAKMPMDQIWRHNLRINDENADFVRKPYESTEITSKATYLGYWSRPFKLDTGDVDIMTYSMPLYDQLGKLQGIIGIDVTINYLTDYMPAAELQPQDSVGYLVAFRDTPEADLKPIIMGGPLQRRMIDAEAPLALSMVNEDMSLYKIENHKGKEILFASVEKVGLYQYNTPFENEEWFLVGIMRGDYLLSYTSRIQQTLWVSLLIAVLLGAIGGLLTSFYMTRPIVSLMNQIQNMDLKKKLVFQRTGYTELDELSHSVEVANEMMLESASRLSKIVNMFDWPIGAFEIIRKSQRYYVTDNFWKILGKTNTAAYDAMTYVEFEEALTAIFSEPEEDEVDVFCIDTEPKRWIRVNKTETADSLIGAIVDVTEEILEKRQILHERDHDPLTHLLNRKGFQWQFEKWYEEDVEGIGAMVMFDLDNLKKVNDSYGHQWGDKYIIRAVEHLKRIDDEGHCVVGRRSGDEFVVLLHGYTHRDEVRERMQAFYKGLLESPIELPDGKQQYVQISAGVMWIVSNEMTYDELLNYADEALYVAKRSGKGIFVESSWNQF